MTTRAPTLRTTRRRLLAGLAAASPALPLSGARAVNIVRLLSGAPEGAPADNWARAFAPFLERHLPGYAIEVVARPEGGSLAMLADLASLPDTLGCVLAPDILARVAASDHPDLLNGFRFLAAVTEEPLVLIAIPGTDLAALRAPGAALALPPPGSTAALSATALLSTTGCAAVHFPSGSAARLAAQSGNVAAALVRLPDTIAALRDSRVVALGTATAARSPLLPDAPTLAEAGIPLTAAARRGFVLPPKSAADLATTFAAAMAAAVADPEYAAQSHDDGILPRLLDEAAWTAELRALPTFPGRPPRNVSRSVEIRP